MSNVKGLTFHSRLKYMQNLDPGGYQQKVKELLPPELVQEIDKGLLSHRWYPIQWYFEFNRAIDRVYGQGDLKLIWELGRLSADDALKGIYKVFYRVGSPEFVVKAAGLVWKQYYDSGKLQVKDEKTDRGKKIHVSIREFDSPAEEMWVAVGGWIERTLELSGGKNVKVEISRIFTQPGSNCEYVCSWE